MLRNMNRPRGLLVSLAAISSLSITGCAPDNTSYNPDSIPAGHTVDEYGVKISVGNKLAARTAITCYAWDSAMQSFEQACVPIDNVIGRTSQQVAAEVSGSVTFSRCYMDGGDMKMMDEPKLTRQEWDSLSIDQIVQIKRQRKLSVSNVVIDKNAYNGDTPCQITFDATTDFIKTVRTDDVYLLNGTLR